MFLCARIGNRVLSGDEIKTGVVLVIRRQNGYVESICQLRFGTNYKEIVLRISCLAA